jgi:hypothetical protein
LPVHLLVLEAGLDRIPDILPYVLRKLLGMILEGLAHLADHRLIRILGQRVQGLHGLQVGKQQAIVVQHELVFKGVFLLQRVSLGLDRLDAVNQVIVDYGELLQLLLLHEKRLASSLMDL